MIYRDLSDLLEYHYWARDRALAAVERLTPDQFAQDLGNSFGSIEDTLTHLYAADWIWCSRWQGESPRAMPSSDAFSDLVSLRAAWSKHERVVRSVLEGFGPDGLEGVVVYRTTDGTEDRTVFWHMLQHVVNHASYHRGQITTMLRQLGAQVPESMDLITYYRGQARR